MRIQVTRMSSLVPGPGNVTRLVADVVTERQIALARGALALALLACSAWLFTLPNRVPRVFGGIAVVFAALWLKRAIALFRKPSHAVPVDYLELSHEGLAFREEGHERRLAWAEIARVAIDQDRLTLALLCHNGEILHIEPRYRGVPLQDLCDAASALHSSAQSSGASAQGAR